MAAGKETPWMKKLDEWQKKGFPQCYALSAYLANKEKPFEEICRIIEKEIPYYNARIARKAMNFQKNTVPKKKILNYLC